MRATLILGLVCCCIASGHAEERIWLNAEINHKPLRLIFDSGASELILFPKTAQRLGLKVTPPPPDVVAGPGEAVGGITEECILTLHGTTVTTRFGIIEKPAYLHWTDEDGIVGWQPISANIFRIDAGAQTVTFLANVPEETATWTKLRVRTQSVLCLETPNDQGATSVILVDTGSSGGVALHPQKWRAWRAAHASQPATIQAFFMPGAGLMVKEQTWATELAFGPLLLSGVPIMEANPAEMTLGSTDFEASLGLAALKRLDFIVDGHQGLAYIRPKKTPPPPYEHNRLGAAFVPRDSYDDVLVASVANSSPAAEAGIRNGDVLLKIGEIDVTKWRTDPGILPLSRFWMRPAGTKLKLALKRGLQTLEITVVHRQILPPDTSSPPLHPDVPAKSTRNQP